MLIKNNLNDVNRELAKEAVKLIENTARDAVNQFLTLGDTKAFNEQNSDIGYLESILHPSKILLQSSLTLELNKQYTKTIQTFFKKENIKITFKKSVNCYYAVIKVVYIFETINDIQITTELLIDEIRIEK